MPRLVGCHLSSSHFIAGYDVNITSLAEVDTWFYHSLECLWFYSGTFLGNVPEVTCSVSTSRIILVTLDRRSFSRQRRWHLMIR